MNTTQFQTEDLPFAAYLCATRRLRFLGCEPVNGNGRVGFVFDDPDSKGEQLNVEFESSATCPAAAFYDSGRHLRRVMDRSKYEQGAQSSAKHKPKALQ
jgi:hypothetical protein